MGTHQTTDELTKRPPNREDGQEILVRGRDELYCDTLEYKSGAKEGSAYLGRRRNQPAGSHLHRYSTQRQKHTGQ